MSKGGLSYQKFSFTFKSTKTILVKQLNVHRPSKSTKENKQVFFYWKIILAHFSLHAHGKCHLAPSLFQANMNHHDIWVFVHRNIGIFIVELETVIIS